MALYTCNICGNTDVDSWGHCVHCGNPFPEDVNPKVKAIAVGRHGIDLGRDADKYEIVGTENIKWSIQGAEALEQLEQLIKRAQDANAVLLLQSIPGILIAALLALQIKSGSRLPIRIGAVISVPGPRTAGESMSFGFDFGEMTSQAELAADAVKFANGQAKTEVLDGCHLKVTVDPIPEFKFDHIEWL